MPKLITIAGSLLPGICLGMAALCAQAAETEFDRWQRLAAAGDMRAQYQLGEIYEADASAQHNREAAILWFLLAAEQGVARAQKRLGEIYYCSPDTRRDPYLAAAWFTFAAEQDDASAQLFLGFMYREGIGVSQSDEMARRWFERAAELGNRKAGIIARSPIDANVNLRLCR